MRGTLFADASYHAESRAAGYGAWFKTEAMSSGALFGGKFRMTMSSSSEAELAGIAKAMARLHKVGSLDMVTVLMIQCDNVRALALVASRIKGAVINNHEDSAGVPDGEHTPTETELQALAVAARISLEAGLSLELRHVRGHHSGGGRQWVNRQCDQLARAHMIEDRKARGWGTKRKKKRRVKSTANPAGSVSSSSTEPPAPERTPSST